MSDFPFNTFKGLVPGVDRRRSDVPYVVDGQNFLVDIDGPYSGLGRTWFVNGEINEPRGIQTLRSSDESQTYLFTGDSICIFDTTSRRLVSIFVHTLRTQFWPWTRALVGGYLYFANKELGLLQYDPVTGLWSWITGVNIPSTVYACCESAGRLCLLGPTALHWSKIDDGSNTGFAPSTATGAGFQLLSIIASSTQPLMLLPYFDGVLTYTSAGIMQSTAVDATNPFRHRVLSRQHVIINPWCVVRVGEEQEEQHIMLCRRGLFATQGTDRPAIWQGLMGEYLHQNILPNIDLTNTMMTIRLDHQFDRGILSVSLAEDSRIAVFTKAFMYYVPSQEWGVYSRVHTGFFEFKFTTGPLSTNYQYGVCDSDGSLFYFSSTDSDNTYPLITDSLIDYKSYFDIPTEYAATSLFSDTISITADDISGVTIAGTYDIRTELENVVSPDTITQTADDTYVSGGHTMMSTAFDAQVAMVRFVVGVNPYYANPLDSYILVGPFQVQPTEIDFVTQFQSAVVGMLDSGINDQLEDYVLDYAGTDVVQDWNSLTGDEDWGTASGDNTSYTTEFIGTVDGYTVWEPNQMTQQIEPELILLEGRSRHLAGSVVGVYNYVKFSTPVAGETFHLKTLRLNLLNAGRLF